MIQIRLNGLKGVLVKALDLEDKVALIQYRPSQYKFHVEHHVLEIVKHFRSGEKESKRFYMSFAHPSDGFS